MKSWLFVGAKVVALVDCSHYGSAPKIHKNDVLTVSVINTSPRGNLCLGFSELGPIPSHMEASWPEARGCWHYLASEFGPVSTIDATSQVEAMRKLVKEATREKVDG